ncbi:hypothetical protein IW18_00590 [Flavobacterium hibernum]|uniref:Uncharacterized protein n=1 Tax=Flavobacterium hibernum TaxID=37752 RepID=A0A0D0EFR2_9FLAO|nr:hypothetical protein IW18_00590 [Flavobacterium hibernum]OXA84612.1 hypothetical protein B0A73_18490 [Flavobacterium hibernum]STO10300.1 Uncharacterised protein [Flavobacterium hibernum]
MQERYARDNRGKNFYKPAKIYANSENKILEIKFIAHKKPEYLEVLNQKLQTQSHIFLRL